MPEREQIYPMNRLFLLALLFSLLLFGSSFDFRSEIRDDRGCLVHIPESISPNGDGINDSFFIETACQYESFSLKIMDHNGRIVFETRNPKMIWDGSENGVPLPQGYYSWVLKFKVYRDGNIFKEKGAIALIR